MDIQKIAHIGTEGVLFIGMFVYFNNQIKKLRDENEELKTKLATLAENTNKQLNNIYMTLDYFKSNMTPAPLPLRVKSSQSPTKGMSLGIKQRKVQFSDEDEPQQKPKPKPMPIHDPEDDLDAELGDELQELEEEEEEIEFKGSNTSNNISSSGKKK